MIEQGTDPPGSFELRPTLHMLGRLLLSTLLVSVIGLSLLEIGLRLLGLPSGVATSVRKAYDLDDETVGPFRADAQVSLETPEGRSDLVTFNSLGCRGAEPDLAAGPPILCVGDSLTFGYGVKDPETWPAQLQRRLQREGIARPVVNLSSAHLLIEDEIHYLERALPVLRPSVVVLLVPPSGYGDPIDAMRRTPHEKSRARERRRRSWPSSWWYASALQEGRTLVNRWRKRQAAQGLPVERPGLRGGGEGLVHLRGRYKERVATFRKKVVESGARFVLAAFPGFTLEGGIQHLEPWSATLREEPDTLYVDVRAAFLAAGGGEDLLLLPHDPHASPRGNEALAGAVFDTLQKAGLLQ